MDRVTINGLTYTNDGIYVDGKPFFENGIFYVEPLDYVNVVRCRDCKYYVDPEDYDLNPYCTNTFEGTPITPNTGRWVRADGFCSWGDRKDF